MDERPNGVGSQIDLKVPGFTARAGLPTLFVDASAVKVQQATITASSPRLRSTPAI